MIASAPSVLSTPVKFAGPRPPTLALLAVLLALLPFAAGLLFHTYAITIQSSGLEASRQIGTLFLAAECWVIIRALRSGFEPASFLRGLPKYGRYLLYVWLMTFSISSIGFPPFRSPLGLMPAIYNVSLLIHLLFAAALSETLAKFGAEELRRIALIIGGATAVFALFIAIKFLGRPWLDDGSSDLKVWQFAIPGFISVRLFGAYTGALLAFVLTVLLQQTKQGRSYLGLYASTTLLVALTLWSGTRAAVLAVGLVVPAIAFMFRLRPGRGVSVRLMLGLAGACFAAWACIPPDDVAFRLIRLEDFQSANSVTGGRLELWNATWAAFLDQPMFGGGPFATSWMLPPEVFSHVQPHNAILQFLVSWGVAGAVPAISLLAWVTVKAHQIVWRLPTLAPVLAMLDALLLMSLFDGTLHFARHVMLAMICYGAIFAMNRHHSPREAGIPDR